MALFASAQQPAEHTLLLDSLLLIGLWLVA
jgi:hypothetical protein